jgi:hypothetical protein
MATGTLLEALRAVIAEDPQASMLNLVATLLLTSLAVLRSPRYHAVGTVVASGRLAVFIVAETLRIG